MSTNPDTTLVQSHGRTAPASLPEGLDLSFFRQCFDDFPDLVMVADLEGAILFLNRAGELLTGRAAEAGDLSVYSEILWVEGHAGPRSLVELCLANGILEGAAVHLRKGSGEWLPHSLTAQLIRDREGRPVGIVAIVRSAHTGIANRDSAVAGSIVPSIIKNFPMPFFTVNTDLTVTYMNAQLEGLTGYRADEVVNKMTCAELLRTPQCHTPHCSIKQAMKYRKPLAGLRRSVLDREGRRIPVALHASMITDADQNVIGGFEAIRDITSVVEAEEKFRMITEINQQGILMADGNRRVVFANSKMGEIFEQPKDELIGKPIWELLPAQHLSIIDDLAQRIDQEHPQQMLYCCTIQPGSTSSPEYRAFETCIIVSRVSKDVLTYVFYRDLTKDIEVERQLHHAVSFLNNIIMSSADGIVVVDTNGKVLIFNEGAERILGYKAEEILGKPIASTRIYSPEVAREIMRRMRSGEYGPPGKLASLRVTLVRKDGDEVPVSFSAAIIKKDDREIGSVGIFSDLRERLRIRRELEEAKIQLMQAEKIASVGRLAAGVAHEINNPLSGILLYADILMNDLADNPQWSADLKEIIDQTLRCKHIVTRLLEFSRQSVGQRVPFEINEIIDRSVELLARQALFKDVEFTIDLQRDIPQMTGDPGQLQQVFTNLIINAGSAMNGKGRIIITSRFDPDCEEVSLQFADTGPGISPEVQDKIFEPFFTTKRPGEGTGLGLSVAYGIIQSHGGTIEVRNAHDGGALFTIMLPLESPESAGDFLC